MDPDPEHFRCFFENTKKLHNVIINIDYIHSFYQIVNYCLNYVIHIIINQNFYHFFI